MILYVDETENDQFFIVAGLLVNNKNDVFESYKKFKHSVKKIKISRKHKSEAFKEFKSFIIDKHYQKIKINMLMIIDTFANRILYGVYKKDNRQFKQRKKEKVYIELFANIVTNINEEIEIIYDGFGNKMFEINIENSIKKYANVISIKSENSQKEPGLQYIDNICSVLRLNISNLDKNNFYSLIKSKIKYCK